MQMTKAIFKNAWPYQKDKMNLPVRDLESSIPFYERVMGFSLVARTELPYKLAVLDRNGIQIGLGENGGDPGQNGCFFEVDNVHFALEELTSNGLQKEISAIKMGTTRRNILGCILCCCSRWALLLHWSATCLILVR